MFLDQTNTAQHNHSSLRKRREDVADKEGMCNSET